MAKIKKAQDGFMARAACRRGVCGKGSVSDRKAARMDKRAERQANKETRREDRQAAKEQRRWERSGLKTGGKVKKAQNGTISYKYPSGNAVTTDTTGYAAGKRRFPAKMEGQGKKLYGTMGRKNVKKTIESTQGKPAKRIGMSMSVSKSAKAKKALGKTGIKLSKKK
jgi:hypothetical protein